MTSNANSSGQRMVSWLLRLLPRSLELQLMLLTSLCLALSILGYGYYIAEAETTDARRTVTAQIEALAHNLATVDAHFLQTNEPEQIEALTLQTASVDGIYSVLVTDAAGFPITEVVNKNGVWSPRYSQSRVDVPPSQSPDGVLKFNPPSEAQNDFLAGKTGTLSAWRRIVGAQPLGWVRVNYRLDTFDNMAQGIRANSLKSMALAMFATLSLLWLLLRPAMRSLREATEFASHLDNSQGARLQVSRRATEIEALGNALNVVSARLLIQNVDLKNQQFALDQHAIVSITNLQGTIIYANERFCNISGYSQGELLGQNHRIVKSDEHPASVFDELWQTITQGKVWHGDVKNRKKDGSFYWVNATIVPLLGVDGLPHQYIGIRTDITANKRLERSLHTAKEQAENAAVAKGQFLANMSHEIRTPMNAILGMLRLLHHTDLNKRQNDYATKAEGAAQSLLGLLNDILDFSKIDAGKMSLEVRGFRLDKLLRDLSVIVSSNVGIKPVEVLFDIDPTTPKALMGDAMRLQQVLINLCSNAVKFTAQGEVVISIRVLAHTAQSVSLRFAVRDTGIGIAPENQSHIFDGFSQAEASTTRRFGGTGLGLSISRRLVSMMGGELCLDSVLGQGSTFSFQITLPVGDVPVGSPALAARLHVLVVDDNPTAREILSAMATSLGWQVDVAADGAQALSMIQARYAPGQTPYQALFIDWQMPGLDGWETVARLQQLTAAVPPVVIMITANGREMLTQRTPEEQSRLHGFLVKPVTASMLFDAVTDALSVRHQPQGTLAAPVAKSQALQGIRLLVVEDNIINQQVAQEMLASEGALVQLADNGQLGVDAVRESLAAGALFDVVLMDIQMPVMDGYAATRLLRLDPRLRDLPIIAMTANAMASDREACLAAGMNEHVGKPFHLAQLIQIIKNPPRLLTQGTPSDAPTPTPAPAVTATAALTALTATPEPQSSNTAVSAPLDKPIESSESSAIHTAAALDRLGGNQALYARVLQSFLQEIAHLPEQLEASLGAADLTTAARLLHTLKGLASTVGAEHLAGVARQAELSVKAAKDANIPPDTATLLAELRTALSSTHSVLTPLAASLAPDAARTPAAPANAQEDVAKLRNLLALLEASDMAAMEVYEELQATFANPDSAEFQRLRQAMDELDFDQAVKACLALTP